MFHLLFSIRDWPCGSGEGTRWREGGRTIYGQVRKVNLQVGL